MFKNKYQEIIDLYNKIDHRYKEVITPFNILVSRLEENEYEEIIDDNKIKLRYIKEKIILNKLYKDLLDGDIDKQIKELNRNKDKYIVVGPIRRTTAYNNMKRTLENQYGPLGDKIATKSTLTLRAKNVFNYEKEITANLGTISKCDFGYIEKYDLFKIPQDFYCDEQKRKLEKLEALKNFLDENKLNIIIKELESNLAILNNIEEDIDYIKNKKEEEDMIKDELENNLEENDLEKVDRIGEEMLNYAKYIP